MSWHPEMPDEYKNQIVTGDALEVMRHIPDEGIHSIVTDPPFFLPAAHYQSRIKWKRNWGDMSILTKWWDQVAEEFRRIIRPDGYVLTFCNGESYPAFLPPMFNRWDRTKNLVWDKTRCGLGRLWRHQHELILVACDTAAYLPNDHKLRVDILRHGATLSKDRKHPVEKPIALLSDLIVACTPVDGVVLDPFAGSGTTCAAAKLHGRSFLGIEISAGYAEIAREQARAISLPLFVMEPEQEEMDL